MGETTAESRSAWPPERGDEAVPGQPATIGLRSVLIVLCSTLGTAAYAFTWNSVSVALPHMQGAFSATTDQITWVMIAFVIGSAMTTASVGWFAARFGRRRVFLVATAGYTGTLLGCALATSLGEEVAWRFVQGAFGAALIPVGQAIAVNAFPPERHGQATSLWALGFVTANVISPTIAGTLIEEFGWPFIFYANLPVGAAVFLAAWFLVPGGTDTARRMDWFGFTTLIVGVGTLQLMLARGERLDWFDSTEIVIEALVAGIALWLLLIHTLTAKRSFIERALFHDRNFVLGQVFIFLIGSVLFLPLLLLPLLLQQIGGYSAIETGYLMLPRGLGSVIGLIIMSQIRDKYDPRPILCAGLLVTAYSTWEMGQWTVEIRAWDVAWASFIQGCATGAIWAPINTLTLSRLNKRIQDQGFALFYLNFDIGSAIGTAAIIGLHACQSQINRAVLSEHINPFNELTRYGPLSEIWSITETGGLAALELEVSRQATMIAYNNSFLVITLVLAALIPLVVLFRHRHPRPAPAA